MAKTEKRKTPKRDDIALDWSLVRVMQNHMHVFGFASVVDNLIATCDDKLEQWEQRREKAKKLRKALGDNYGRN